MESKETKKSGFSKINPYQEYAFKAPLESWFLAVEAVLGFKLFYWQKSFIAYGVFRRYGETTAKILRQLSQVSEPPLNLVKYKTRGERERWFCEELLRVKSALDNAGVPTRKVLLTVRDEQEYLKRKMEAIDYTREDLTEYVGKHYSAKKFEAYAPPDSDATERLEELRATGRFWDF